MWNLVSHTKRKTYIDAVQEEFVEENCDLLGQDSILTPGYGTVGLSRNVGNKLPLLVA
jgi:hypothetical protein